MQQLLLSRVGVLVLIDQDHVVGLPLPLTNCPAGQQRRGDPDDLRVVVGRNGGQVEPCRVPRQEATGGLPVVPSQAPAQPGQRGPVQPALGPAKKEVPQFRGEATGGQRGPQPLRPAGSTVLGLATQQAPYLKQLFRAGQQGGRFIAGQRELTAHERIRVTVEGQGERLTGGPVQPRGDPLPELLGGLAAEGKHEHPLGVDAAAGDAVHHGFHDRCGLPGAGPGQDQQRLARVVHHRLLRLVQHRSLVRLGRRTDEVIGRELPVHVVRHSSRSL